MSNKLAKLSIVIITMNRHEQLIEAIDSCLKCQLPEQTKILVFDNGSTDDTYSFLKEYLADHPNAPVMYHRSDINLGVGGGRSVAFELVDSKYVYFLDDDALIEEYCRDFFFTRSISFMENHKEVASLSTDINDKYLGKSRTTPKSKRHIDGKPCIMMYLGGSHFLRSSAFSTPLYLNIKYALEELYPSIQAIDKGYYHVLDKSISIYHNPMVNKWDRDSEQLRDIQVSYCVNNYCSKRILYPAIFIPVLKIAFYLRCQRYSIKNQQVVKQLMNEFDLRDIHNRIHVRTVMKLLRDFGMKIF
jgi:Predicted glycosyltransferases